MATHRFTFDPTYDLAATIRGVKDPVMVGPTEFWWNTRTPDGLGSLSMQRTSDTTVEAEVWGPGSAWLIEQTPKLIGEDDNLDGFKPTGKLAEYWRRKPFKLGRSDRPWDALVGGVFGQKVQVTKAVASRRALAATFGDPAPGPRPGWILPSANQVANMGYHQFHRLGVERKRAGTLIRCAKEFVRAGQNCPPDKLFQRLEQVHGIGPWTTNMVAAAAFGDADAVPVGDFHLPNIFCWAIAGEPRGTDKRMLELLEPYAGHRWRALRLAKASGKPPKYGPRLSLIHDGMTMGK